MELALHRLTLSAALFALHGCANPVIPGDVDLLVTTDQASYSAVHVNGEGNYREYEFTIRARVENAGTGTAFLERCRPEDQVPSYGVESIEAIDTWGSGYNPNWGCAGHDRHIRLDPGETRYFTMRLKGPNAWDGRTKVPFGVMTGEMRLHLPVSGCSRCLPADQAVSNTFVVEIDEP